MREKYRWLADGWWLVLIWYEGKALSELNVRRLLISPETVKLFFFTWFIYLSTARTNNCLLSMHASLLFFLSCFQPREELDACRGRMLHGVSGLEFEITGDTARPSRLNKSGRQGGTCSWKGLSLSLKRSGREILSRVFIEVACYFMVY